MISREVEGDRVLTGFRRIVGQLLPHLVYGLWSRTRPRERRLTSSEFAASHLSRMQDPELKSVCLQ